MTPRKELPSDRLRRARKALGLTDSKMAEAVGLQGENAKDDYRKMETGLRAVTGPVLVAAEALVLLRKYMAHVDTEEGIAFLPRVGDMRFAPEEVEALRTIGSELKVGDRDRF